MKDKKAPRFVPILTGIFWVFLSILLLFWHPDGILYYIRNFLGACMLLFGINSLKIGIFASDKEICLRVAGLSEQEIKKQLTQTDIKK